MNSLRKVWFCFGPAAGLLGFTALVLAFPDRVAAGAAEGLTRCCTVMIPALFPFLVISQCLTADACAKPLARLFAPLARLYGIPQESGAALLLSGLGGFAPGCACAGRLCRSGALSDRDAAVLACGCATVSPAFAVTVIGGKLLGNLSIGWLFFFLLYASNLLCTLLTARCMRRTAPHFNKSPHPEPFSLVDAVNRATTQIVQICGFVILFSILGELTAPQLPAKIQGIWQGLLELSAGIGASAAASALMPALVSCCTLGICGIMQMRALLPGKVSLLPVLLTRPLHLALSWGLLRLAFRFLPGELAVWAGGRRLVAVCRLPWQSGMFFFLFLAIGCRLIAQHPSHSE